MKLCAEKMVTDEVVNGIDEYEGASPVWLVW